MLLPAAGCGSAAARSVSSTCAKFVRHAWEPYIGRQHDACWRFSLPPNGVGDLLGTIVPLTAEAMLMNRALEIRIRDGGAGKNNTVLDALGLFERPALARCQQAKRVEKWDSVQARTISAMWSRNDPFKSGGHRLASNQTHRTHETLDCMLRLYLCPKPAVLQQQDTLKARLRSSRQTHLGLDTTWVALHARLASGTYLGREDKLLPGRTADVAQDPYRFYIDSRPLWRRRTRWWGESRIVRRSWSTPFSRAPRRSARRSAWSAPARSRARRARAVLADPKGL